MGGPGTISVSSEMEPFYFTTARKSNWATREDYPELPQHVWDQVVSGTLPKGATRFKRSGQTDLVVWKSKSGGWVEWYVDLPTDIDYFLERIPEQFGLDRRQAAEYAAYANQTDNELMWYFVNDKNYSPTRAMRETFDQSAALLKLVVAGSMTMLGSGPRLAPGTNLKSPNLKQRVNSRGKMTKGGVSRTSRRADPKQVPKQFNHTASKAASAVGKYQNTLEAARAKAQMNGRYENELAYVYMPDDIERYGEFRDFDRWYKPMNYYGRDVPGGWWVWSSPFHFIFKSQVLYRE